MKFLKKTLVVLVVVIVIFLLGKNMIVKGAVENGVRLVTGLELSIKGLDLGILDTHVGIHEMKLYNPKGFEDRLMLDMPEIFVSYDLPSIMKGKVYLPELRVSLKEFLVIKDKQGKMNLDAITGLAASKEGVKKEEPSKAKAPAPEIQIDSFKLHLGKVIFKDYSKGAPSVREFDIGLNEEYKNITNPNTLVGLIVMKVMLNTPIAALSNFDMGGLEDSVAGALASSKKLASDAAVLATGTLTDVSRGATDAVKNAPESLKKATGALEGTAKDLGGELKNTAENLKDKLKLFGGDSE